MLKSTSPSTFMIWLTVAVLIAFGIVTIQNIRQCQQIRASDLKTDAARRPTKVAPTISENYANEGSVYTYTSQNGKCPMNYRTVDDGNLDLPPGRDRCASCASFDPINYEYYCPHNCRQYGVSLCDQGKIM